MSGVLIEGLIAGLQGDVAAREVLGDPVRVWDQVPRDAAFPYVQIGRCESRSLGADGGGQVHQLVLSCVSRFEGMEEARAVAQVVEAVLERLVLAQGRLVSCEVRGLEVSRSGDMRRAFAVMRVRAVVD